MNVMCKWMATCQKKQSSKASIQILDDRQHIVEQFMTLKNDSLEKITSRTHLFFACRFNISYFYLQIYIEHTSTFFFLIVVFFIFVFSKDIYKWCVRTTTKVFIHVCWWWCTTVLLYLIWWNTSWSWL